MSDEYEGLSATFADACKAADLERERQLPRHVTHDDFFAYSRQNLFIYRHDGSLWPAGTINSRLGKKDGLKASVWLHIHKPVEQMTWAPGEPKLIKDKLIIDGGWIEVKGVTTYNLYHPPHFKEGEAGNAEPWIEHVHKVYPDDADHIIRWCAYRCQHPDIKINHALVLSGNPGVGKDTLLEPVKHTVGEWNCTSVSPPQLLGRFNGFRKSVILIVTEARDLGDINRPQFYEATKEIIASPPAVLRVDEKHTHEYAIPNLCGVVITTNYKTGGIYLPANDRRHFVAWSPRDISEFSTIYWNRLWSWYESGGLDDVAAYLMALDVRSFDPHAPPPKTNAFWEIVNSSRSPEDNEMNDVLQVLRWPDIVTIEKVIANAEPDFAENLKDRRYRKIIPRRMEACGYVIVNNPDSKDGRWWISGKNRTIYGRASLTFRDQVAAIRKVDREGEWFAEVGV